MDHHSHTRVRVRNKEKELNAVELRESLRALAATILHIVQYETTEAEVIAALKENRRLTDELEKVLYKDYLCRQIDQRIKQDLIDEANKEIHDCCSPCSDPKCPWLHHAPEEFKPVTRSTPEKRPDWINAPFITRGKAE